MHIYLIEDTIIVVDIHDVLYILLDIVKCTKKTVYDCIEQ